jgi:alkaline phosphatase
VDVNLYAYGQGTEILRGSHENTEIGDFISRYLHLDLNEITDKLVEKTNGSRSVYYKTRRFPLLWLTRKLYIMAKI